MKIVVLTDVGSGSIDRAALAAELNEVAFHIKHGADQGDWTQTRPHDERRLRIKSWEVKYDQEIK